MADSTFHDEEFQNVVLAYLWREPSYFSKYEDSLSPTYFDSSVNQAIFGCISSYHATYRKTPSREVLCELTRSQYPKDTEDDTRKRAAQAERVSQLFECDITDDKFIDLKVREFVAYKAMYEFVSGALGGLKAGKYDPDLPKKARLALAKGEKAFETGLHWTGDSYSRVISYYEEDTSLKMPTNIPLFDEHVRKGGMRAGELGLILALPKGFKCSSPCKENLMYDGTVRKSRDIKVGDLLMGDDSTPREVLEVGSGRSQMYRVTQANGDPYEVTGEHVLCLKYDDQFLEIEVENFLKESETFRSKWKGYKVGIDFTGPIPTIVEERTQDSVLKVESIGEGDWCGFLLDGNHHYLFSDFTVTHNSGTMLNFGYGALKHFYQHSPAFRENGDTKTYDVGYITLELSEELVASRFDRCCLGWDLNRILEDPVGAAKGLDQMRRFLGGDLYIKQYASKAASCDTIREYLDRMWEQKGVKFSELFVDYLDLVKMSGGQTRLREDTVSALICEELRELAIDYKIPIWSAVRATREAVSSPNVSMKHMSKSFERIGIADLTIALCQTEQEKQEQKMRIVPIASRNDAEGKQINCTIDYSRMRLYADEVVDIEYDDAKGGSKGGGGGKAFDAFSQKGLMKKGPAKTSSTGEATD